MKLDIRPHRKLDAWKRAMEMARNIYSLTENFPKEEIYGITNQLRKSALSVPSNIAEGAARKSRNEFLQFLNIAQGSLSELDTQIELSYMLNYILEDKYQEIIDEITIITKLISGLIRKIQKQ